MTPFEFEHSLTDQINGQIEAGFIISGFYEDKGEELLDEFTSTFIVTKAEKIHWNILVCIMLQRVERLKKPSTKMKCVIARPDPLILLQKD